jgi:ABC-2 type transport system permease protein
MMTRMIRADLYRVLRGKAIYIIFAFMLVQLALTIFVFQVVPVVTGPIDEERMTAPEIVSAAVAADLALNSIESLSYYFVIPFIVAVTMATFSSGAVKNELPTGISRMSFYLSKWVLTSVLCIVFMVISFCLSITFAIFVGGVGYWGDGHFANVMASLGMQAFAMLAVNSVATFLCFITRKTAAAVGAYFAVILVPMMTASMLSVAFPRAAEFLYYDLISQFVWFAQTAALSAMEFTRGTLVILVYLVLPMIAGIAIFRRAEIR